MTKEKQTIFQLRMPYELHRALRKAAFEVEQSMNQFIIEAITNAIAVGKRWEKVATQDKAQP